MSAQISERRPLGTLGRMGVVAALHAGAFYVIANSLGIVPSLSDPETETFFVEDAVPRDEPIPQPEPDLAPRRETVFVPAPDDRPLVYDQDVITEPPVEVIEREGETGGSAVVQPLIVAVHQDSRYPLSQPPYPPADIRAGNTGTADIEVYVLPSGRVGDARIVKSTGFATLDRSAMEEAKRRWRLAPATRDGVPFAEWHRLRVTFKLNQQQR
jgi:protein TonB